MKNNQIIAHIRPSDGAIQTLEQHAEGVSRLAAVFASAFAADAWGRWAGLWHDIGKTSAAFQEYIGGCQTDDANAESLPGKVDHSSAGAQHAVSTFPVLGHLLAYPLSGHHSGLLDAQGAGACLSARLHKELPPFRAPSGTPPHPALPPHVADHIARRDGFGTAFFVRMLFSCLCDADFLDTEAFMQPTQHARRPSPPPDLFDRMAVALDATMTDLAASSKAAPEVDDARASVRRHCLEAATKPPGFFSLTVPTGGGKTLSSLAFALAHIRRHAQDHALRRILYVVPFTTIIEQNADAFRRALRGVAGIPADELVLEHHCNVDPEKESHECRLASENWDAPLIVTTSVQFYESLFSARPSACRKLHNIARSVIILDEAQSIPVEYLQPCLRALQELVEHYGCTVVFCTATQPAVERRPDFPIGIDAGRITEIVPDPQGLYLRLKRVALSPLGVQTDTELIDRLSSEPQALCIVKTTGHAAKLAQLLAEDESCLHLSTRMCPAHRTRVLSEIRARLNDGRPCHVVSTTLVEAGVDLDFPVVFRAMAGIDSIAQAAGRCNRGGTLPSGRVYVFEPEHRTDQRFLIDEANSGRQVFALHPDDPLDLSAIEHYFRLHFWSRKPLWDRHAILDAFHIVQDRELPFLFDFSRVAADFRLIKDDTHPVVIPYGPEGEALCEELRSAPVLDFRRARRIQRYAVSVRTKPWFENLNRTFEPRFGGSLAILHSAQTNYSERYGLHLEGPSGEAVFC